MLIKLIIGYKGSLVVEISSRYFQGISEVDINIYIIGIYLVIKIRVGIIITKVGINRQVSQIIKQVVISLDSHQRVRTSLIYIIFYYQVFIIKQATLCISLVDSDIIRRDLILVILLLVIILILIPSIASLIKGLVRPLSYVLQLFQLINLILRIISQLVYKQELLVRQLSLFLIWLLLTIILLLI